MFIVNSIAEALSPKLKSQTTPPPQQEIPEKMLSIDNELEAAQEEFTNDCEENQEEEEEVQEQNEEEQAEEVVETIEVGEAEEQGIPAESPETEEATPMDAEAPETPTKPVVCDGKAKRLFIGNISYSSTEEDVKAYFEEKFGPESLVEIQVMKKKKIPGQTKQQHRGFGFMKFATQEITETVMAETHNVGGKNLNINLAKEKTVKFFVGGIARDTTTTETLTAFFEPYGEIRDAFCLVTRGFGFVTIVDDGDNLKPLMAKAKHEIDGKMCDVKVAQPKGQVGGRGGRGRGGRGGRRGGRRGGYQQQQGQWGGGAYRQSSWGAYGGAQQSPYGGQRQGYTAQYSPYNRQAPGGYTQY